MRYIIKNCPEYFRYKIFHGEGFSELVCANCEDCLLKSIIDKCRERSLTHDTTACEILSLINIEEIKEDE